MSDVLDFPVKPEARDYLACFAADPTEPAWLGERRRQGMTRFAELGWPSRRSESWRYLDLSPIGQMRPAKPVSQQVGPAAIEPLLVNQSGQRVVLVDGRFAPALSKLSPAAGVWFGSTAQTVRERTDLGRAVADAFDLGDSEAFDALNAAFFSDGFVLEIAPGTTLDDPIEIVHLAQNGTDASLHTRSLITLGKGARAAIVETYVGHDRYWRNDLVTVRLGQDAELSRCVLIEEAAEAIHLSEVAVTLAAKSRLSNFALLIGGRTMRHEARVELAGESAYCGYDGAFIVAGRDETNFVTTIDHVAPGGETRELVKGVGAGRGHGAFQGRIVVRPGAQKTDAHQMSRNLIIGDRAVIDTKPELEIHADDVKCSHGASIGDLDENALFYLRARGIPEDEARRLLIDGFLREAVETVEHAAIRDHLLRRLENRLATLEAIP